MRRSQREIKKKSPLKIINLLLLIVFLMISGFVIFTMYRFNILNFKMINHLVTGITILIALISMVSIFKNKLPKFTFLILLLSIGVSAFGVYSMQTLVGFSNRIQSNAQKSQQEVEIVVLKESTISELQQIQSLVAPMSVDKENIDALLNDIQSKHGIAFTPTEVNSYLEAFEKLLAKNTNAMILNSAYKELIQSEYPDFENQIKVISKVSVEKNVTAEESKDSLNQQSKNAFTLYISGIDTYGPVSSVSRSDVNILMTVNLDTQKVILTTTPRDSYVRIANGGRNQYDKLTHAGIYGVNASVKTLENLYNITINNYVRLNFTSFLKLIDVVGGVTVNNTQTFTSHHGNIYFPAGPVTLNSEKALVFVRERYNLANGDHDRGKNQEKVIAALINKLSSPNNLRNFGAILSALEGSLQTDLSLNTIMNIVNQQLEKGTSFSVESQAITGTGSIGLPSFAMPSAKLYMMQINQSSLNQAISKIKNVLNGN